MKSASRTIVIASLFVIPVCLLSSACSGHDHRMDRRDDRQDFRQDRRDDRQDFRQDRRDDRRDRW